MSITGASGVVVLQIYRSPVTEVCSVDDSCYISDTAARSDEFCSQHWGHARARAAACPIFLGDADPKREKERIISQSKHPKVTEI